LSYRSILKLLHSSNEGIIFILLYCFSNISNFCFCTLIACGFFGSKYKSYSVK